jgi:hypothetical protein
MKFITFYFSGSNNTKWVCEQFDQMIRDSGHETEIISIDNFKKRLDIAQVKEKIITSQYIGFAQPIYGANLPPIMRDFLVFISQIMKDNAIGLKPVYFINTFGYINALGPFATQKILSSDCFLLQAYGNFRICNNIMTYKQKMKPITEKMLSKRKKEAKKHLFIMVNQLISGKKYTKGIGPYLLPGILIRKKLKKQY